MVRSARSLLLVIAVAGGLAVSAAPAQATIYQWYWVGAYGNEAECNVERMYRHEPQYGTWTFPCVYAANDPRPGGPGGAGWYFQMKVSLD